MQVQNHGDIVLRSSLASVEDIMLFGAGVCMMISWEVVVGGNGCSWVVVMMAEQRINILCENRHICHWNIWFVQRGVWKKCPGKKWLCLTGIGSLRKLIGSHHRQKLCSLHFLMRGVSCTRNSFPKVRQWVNQQFYHDWYNCSDIVALPWTITTGLLAWPVPCDVFLFSHLQWFMKAGNSMIWTTSKVMLQHNLHPFPKRHFSGTSKTCNGVGIIVSQQKVTILRHNVVRVVCFLSNIKINLGTFRMKVVHS